MGELIRTLLIAVPLSLVLVGVLAWVMVRTRAMAEMEIQALDPDRTEADLRAELDEQPLFVAGHQPWSEEAIDRGTRRLLSDLAADDVYDVFPEEN